MSGRASPEAPPACRDVRTRSRGRLGACRSQRPRSGPPAAAEDEQIVLGLRFGRDLTVPQIAAQLGLPEGTVKSGFTTRLNTSGSARCRAPGGGAETMNAPDLETMLRSYYGRFAPDDSTRVVLASRRCWTKRAIKRPVRPLWASSRLVAALAVAALLLAAWHWSIVGPTAKPVTGPSAGQRTTSRSPTRRSAMPE